MANAPAEATYLVQQVDPSLPNAQALASLPSSGILKNSEGILAIANPESDYLPFNLELASIAALNPAQGDILVAINNESWGKLSMGSAGHVLTATVEGPTYQPAIPFNTSIITATASTGTVPSSRVLVGGDGIGVVDVPDANSLFVVVTGILDSLFNLGTQGIIVNNSGTAISRSIISAGSTLAVENPQGIAGNISLDVNNDTTFQRVRVASNGSILATRSELNFIAGQNIGITIQDDGLNNKVNITLSANTPSIPAGVNWQITSISGAMRANKGYIVNGGSLVNLSLPSTSSVGDMIQVADMGGNGWTITQAASQQILFGEHSTTAGTTGSLASTGIHDAITLVCVVPNTTFLVVSGPQGTLTVI